MKARDVFSKNEKDVDYVNVKSDPDNLQTMLKHSKGVRKVPVIVEDGEVTIGYQGKS